MSSPGVSVSRPKLSSDGTIERLTTLITRARDEVREEEATAVETWPARESTRVGAISLYRCQSFRRLKPVGTAVGLVVT